MSIRKATGKDLTDIENLEDASKELPHRVCPM